MFDTFVLDAISSGETDFDYETPANAQRLLTQFNHEIESVISEHGTDATGNAIWYLYGCLSSTTHDALDESVETGYATFYQSIESLYDNGFAIHCANDRGHSDVAGGEFSTACYMLWDMDSELEYLSFNGPSVLFGFVENLVDFGLRHKHAAVQESFLHCLGHRQHDKPEFVASRLATFCRRSDITPSIREYAKQCQTGMIL
jgi:hypothetical protein